jgi:hypothetical protein
MASVLSFVKLVLEDFAATRADRWPISAPPTPTASAIDPLVVDGAGAGVGASVVVGVAGTGAGEEEESGTGTAGEDVGAGADVVVSDGGVGAGSTAKATPERLGPVTSKAARRAVHADCRTG